MASVQTKAGHFPQDALSDRRLLERELADSRLLHEISTEFIGEKNPERLHEHILDSAMRLMRSQFASMQILDASTGGKRLLLLGHRGFTPEAARHWQSVDFEGVTSCAEALRQRARAVVADIEQCPRILASPELAVYRQTGIRAMQTTPLLTRGGALIGMLSTHWSAPHEPAPRELRLFDILARQAADLLDLHQTESALRERERNYRAVFDSVDEGLCLLDRIDVADGAPADFLCVDANRMFREQSGIADPVGRTMRDALPDEPESTYAIYAQVLRSGAAHRFERILDNGRALELYAFRVDDGSGRRIGVTFKDMTGRKRRESQAALFSAIAADFSRLSDADELMQAAGARIGAFLQLSMCLFLDVDGALGTATVAHQWARAGAPNLIGTYRIADFVDGDLLQRLGAGEPVAIGDTASDPHTHAENFAALGIRSSISVPFHRNGHWRSLLVLVDVVPRAWRRYELELLRELANRTFPRLERARAEAALRESEERLRHADRMKDEFLATLAHELRNPLAPVRNALHLLRLSKDPPERLYDMLDRQVAHIVRLVDDLLEVSRVSRGVIDLKRERVPLDHVLRIAIETSRPLIESGRHELAVDIDAEPLPVCGDVVRLAQVFSNLLNNAAKYTDAGGRIELSAAREGDCAVVRVHDNGIGIAPAQLPRLFEMFAQVDRTAAHAQGGLGIGLWLVQRLVAMHGGSVAATSAGLGHGSCFSVRLPLERDAAQAGVKAVPDPADLRRRRVLVVDDNRDAADSLGMLLDVLGAEVRIAHDGAGALALLDEWQPSVVLLDLGMPGMDGYEVARRIRAERRHDGLLLVAITGWGQEDDRRRTRAAGFDHHLVKPFGLEALQDLLVDPAAARRASAPR